MIAILIPTRNRADLAIAAARSVLVQGDARVRLVISDNSSDTSSRIQLKGFGEQTGVKLLTTPGDLPMAQHWNWAFEQISDYDYIGILTDRMIMYPGALNELRARIEDFNQPSVISFNNDNVAAQDGLYAPIQRPFFGKAERIPANLLIEQTASAKISTALPRGLNSIIRADVMQRVRSLSGKAFESIAPDFNLAFKTLAVVDHIFYIDKPLIISYGNSRSNGGSLTTGHLNNDARDFLKFVTPEQNPLSGSPMPDIFQATNVVCHEYGTVRRQFSPHWLAPQIKSWVELIVRRVKNSDGALSTAWKSRLVESYGVPASTFNTPNTPNFKQRLISALIRFSPRGMAKLYRWLGKARFATEGEALAHLLHTPRSPSASATTNMDF